MSRSSDAERVWSRRLAAIGQPVTAGPAGIVLVRTGGGSVELVSLDRSSGKENFRIPFHPGGLPTGVVMTPRTTRNDAGRHLAILRRFEPGAPNSGLVAVDVRTGTVVASTPSAIDDYDACSDGRDVCWSGYLNAPDAYGIVSGAGPTRWDLESGRVLENEGQEGARSIGDDLYFRGSGRTAVVSRLKGGQRTVWRQSAWLAVAPGANADLGWSFERDEQQNVYVGSLGRPVPPALIRRYRAGQRVELDYTRRYLTVGIDGRTGEQLWSRRGADPWCSLLRSVDGLDARTLCVVDGTNVQREGRDPRDRDLTVAIEGIDPRSGETSWSFELTGEEAEKAYRDDVAPLAPYGMVLPSDEGPVALDLRTGERQLVADDTVLFCTAESTSITVYGVQRPAGDLYRTCTRDGRDTDASPSAFGVAGLEGEGDTRYVAMPGRLVAFRL